tara:strand:+ start:531 stop:776 length:246 start_codon:yes stop_codon:yes gene_type:complete
MSINWFSYTSYLKYKNECLDASCSGLKINETNKTSTQKLNGETCKWTNYGDYIRYKNMKLMVQDVEGIHESLNGNSKTINM